jgi:glutathione S-transferase
MRLHYNPMSSSSRRVTITAALLGIRFDAHVVDLRDRAARAALEKLNANSKVPVIEDEGFVLWESNAIMQYLCERTPGQTLYPAEPRARAEVNRWLSWSAAHWSTSIGNLGWEHVWKKMVTGQDADPEQVKRHEVPFNQFATVLDNHLATRTWVAGPELTIADIAIATPLMMTRPARLPIRPYTRIAAWHARIQELPAWKATEPPPIGTSA